MARYIDLDKCNCDDIYKEGYLEGYQDAMHEIEEDSVYEKGFRDGYSFVHAKTMKITIEDWEEYKSNASKILSDNGQYATKKAIEIAIEKQVPNKPYTTVRNDVIGLETYYSCPVCKTSIYRFGVKEKFCPECGQAICWE